MQKTTLALLMASLLFATSACQPPSDRPESASNSESAANLDANNPDAIIPSTQPPSDKPLAEAKTPKALTSALIQLSEKRLTNDLICTKLSNTMQAIDNKSEFSDIQTIQRQLTACLPTTDNPQVLQWLTAYQALYERFLEIPYNSNEQSFYTLMNLLEQGQKPTVELLKAVNPRLRYLVGFVQSKADIKVLYVGEGDYIFHHDLKAMADLFSPYLPEEQSAFIQQMAKDNQHIFWNDAGIAITFEAVIARAVFWENYIQRYPSSYFVQDAKSLLAIYRYVLFFGSENTQWTDDDFRKFYSPKDEFALKLLSKRSNSILAQDAQNFLDFMALPASKRQRSYPAPSKNNNGDKMDKRAISHYQLTAALSIPSPWLANNKNCFTGVVCVDDNIE